MQDWRQSISIDPKVCHGKPCIKGSRTWVSSTVDNLDIDIGSAGEQVVEAYPT